MLLFDDFMKLVPPGHYSTEDAVNMAAHVEKLSLREMHRMLSDHIREIGPRHGKTLKKHRTKDGRLWLIESCSPPVSNETIAAADEARREGIATGAVAGLLRAHHGLGMMAAQGTALAVLSALSEMGFTWRTATKGGE